MRDWRQYCSYLGPVGSGEQYGRAITTTSLLLRVDSAPNVFGMVYLRVNSRSAMLSKGVAAGRTRWWSRVDGTVACCCSPRCSSTAREPSRLSVMKSREALNIGSCSKRRQVSCAE